MNFEAKMKPILNEKLMSIYHRMQAARFAKILKTDEFLMIFVVSVLNGLNEKRAKINRKTK